MAQLIVKHHRPLRTWLAGVSLAALAAAAVWAAFVIGEYRAGFDREAAASVQAALDEAQRNNTALNEQIVALQQERDVDRAARAQVQASLEDLQHKLLDQQEELAFYRGIVSPASSEEGIHVQSVKFTDGGAPRLYHYRIVLIQVRTRELHVNGSLSVKIYGAQGGKPAILDARDLAPGGKPPVDFSFQYFQNLEGDVVLPEGFVPGRVEVTVRENGHDPVTQNFDWADIKS